MPSPPPVSHSVATLFPFPQTFPSFSKKEAKGFFGVTAQAFLLFSKSTASSSVYRRSSSSHVSRIPCVQLCWVSAVSEHMHRAYPFCILAFPRRRWDGTAPRCASVSVHFSRKVVKSTCRSHLRKQTKTQEREKQFCLEISINFLLFFSQKERRRGNREENRIGFVCPAVHNLLANVLY